MIANSGARLGVIEIGSGPSNSDHVRRRDLIGDRRSLLSPLEPVPRRAGVSSGCGRRRTVLVSMKGAFRGEPQLSHARRICLHGTILSSIHDHESRSLMPLSVAEGDTGSPPEASAWDDYVPLRASFPSGTRRSLRLLDRGPRVPFFKGHRSGAAGRLGRHAMRPTRPRTASLPAPRTWRCSLLRARPSLTCCSSGSSRMRSALNPATRPLLTRRIPPSRRPDRVVGLSMMAWQTGSRAAMLLTTCPRSSAWAATVRLASHRFFLHSEIIDVTRLQTPSFLRVPSPRRTSSCCWVYTIISK